jgi:uncharacterized repeat protein (TIGR03843 family)
MSNGKRTLHRDSHTLKHPTVEEFVQAQKNTSDLTGSTIISLLESGEIVDGLKVPWSSNSTFLVRIKAKPTKYFIGVYKPQAGERPLHDFPSGSLYKRETASFLISRVLGWPDVPYTLIRNGPYGIGTLQLYIDHDPNVTYFDLLDGNSLKLQAFAVFDMLINNADRKAGHCIVDKNGIIWSIDHGLTFLPLPKLRTVMLELWGQPIHSSLLGGLEDLLKRLLSRIEGTLRLSTLLSQQETDALIGRCQVLLKKPVLPKLDPFINTPWPLV